MAVLHKCFSNLLNIDNALIEWMTIKEDVSDKIIWDMIS